MVNFQIHLNFKIFRTLNTNTNKIKILETVKGV